MIHTKHRLSPKLCVCDNITHQIRVTSHKGTRITVVSNPCFNSLNNVKPDCGLGCLPNDLPTEILWSICPPPTTR